MKTILAITIAAGALGAVAYAGDSKGKFDRFDKDGDGFLSKDEMEAFHEARSAAREARRFPDANNNGTVDRREFEDASRARFDELDANGDGLISKDEIPEHPRGMRRHQEDED